MKAESLEKLNCNLASENARTTENSCKRTVYRVSNYPFNFDICKFGALFPDNYNKLKRAKFVFCYMSLSSIIIFSFILDFYTNW